MPSIQVYSRPGCHLCEELIEEITPLLRGRAVLEVRNIEDEPEWLAAYDTRIPVVEMDGQLVCQYRLDRGALHRILSGTDSAYADS